ncbi:ATP-binding protein [Trinickia acidisoli]|uniref:ATP-binding protein n=1 Tax=Trinickia acidisoli TaxID=2767482 RepID=UPI001F5C0B0E|nr:ATP-binding protein [Trinickia acidisoli]
MRNPLNTLFGRMALLTTVVLLAIQSTWFITLAIREPRHEADGFAHGILLALQAANSRDMGLPRAPMDSPIDSPMRPLPLDDMSPNGPFHGPPGPLGPPPMDDGNGLHPPPMSRGPHGPLGPPGPPIRTVPWNKVPPTSHLHEPTEPPLVHTIRFLREHLPTGSTIAVDDDRPPHIWVRTPSSANWIVVPLNMPPPPHFMLETASILIAAIILSVFVAWQMQRPLSRVALAARTFGAGGRPAPVGERGPRELRDLISAFNDMMRRLNEADDDQAVMLAGVAHDLKAPLTRLKLRASLIADEQDRAGLLHDVDSLSNIVEQFLEFAGQAIDDGLPVETEAFLRTQFTVVEEGGGDGPLFELDLHAGPSFTLPRVLLDRLMTNLVDNALEHGAAPIRIHTAREDGEWVLTVRDHGTGIPEDRIAAAMKPFVRLDAARGGEGHCGLGLAIVSRLVRDHGGRCDVSNHPEGGLQVKIALPVT